MVDAHDGGTGLAQQPSRVRRPEHARPRGHGDLGRRDGCTGAMRRLDHTRIERAE